MAFIRSWSSSRDLWWCGTGLVARPAAQSAPLSKAVAVAALRQRAEKIIGAAKPDSDREKIIEKYTTALSRKVDPVRTPEAAAEEARRWEALGAPHVTFNSNDVGMKSADLHIDAIRRFREALGD